MERDHTVFQTIDKEKNRQLSGLELIASENFVSNQVMEAVGSVLTNKYAEGLPGKRYYGGCEFVDEAEDLARERAKELFGAEWANVQPHSGAQANAAVMMGLLKPGDTILGFNLSHGGHLTHGSPVNFSGKLYEAHFYGVDEETGYINYEEMEQKAYNERPRLIIAGGSAYSRDWDYERFRKVADDIGALLLTDMAHPAGIIAKGHLEDPLKYSHVVTTTTHKTLRGPRGGMILMKEDFPNFMGITTGKGKRKRMSTILDSSVFPGQQGGPLEHVIAGKAVAFKEALSNDFTEYTRQVVNNAKKAAQLFQDKGYKVITGGTDNHLMLIDLRPKNVTGKEAEEALEKAGITINKNMVPYDDQPALVTSGMRIGTSAITTRGMKEKEIEQIVEFIDSIIERKDDESFIKSTKEEVARFCHQFPLFAEEPEPV